MKDTTGAERQQRRRARLAIAREVAFIRPDWGLFLHPDRLPQKAGCPRDQLRAMILKELVDNALDAGATATLAQIDRDTWMVTDDGPGFDRGQVLRLFAVNRPMVSTKLLRRPTRGAIGNGLRVVMGGAVASGGTLQVECRGARYVLDVDRETGDTAVVEENQGDVVVGSRVTVAFGLALPRGADDGGMALQAIRCAGPAARPMLSHPDWYDRLAFAELTHAAEPGTTVARIAAEMGVRLDDDRPATEADLGILKALAGPQPVLLPLGADCFPGSYAKETRGAKDGLPVPVQVEAWAEAARCAPSRARRTVMPIVNRSPVAGADQHRVRDRRQGGHLRLQPQVRPRARLAGRQLRHRPRRDLPRDPGHQRGQGARPAAAVERDRARARPGHAQGVPRDPAPAPPRRR